MQLSRRSLITGLASFMAAPAIVRVGSIMPVKAWAPATPGMSAIEVINKVIATVTAICPEHQGDAYYASITDGGLTFITRALPGDLPRVGDRVLLEM